MSSPSGPTSALDRRPGQDVPDTTSDDDSPQETCQNCGNHVSPDFGRVFGDSEGVVHRCSECDTFARLCSGSAAGKKGLDRPDREEGDRR